MTTLRVGLLQTAPEFGAVDDNLAGITELHEGLAPVDLALTPELSAHGYGFGPHRDADLLSSGDPRLEALVAAGVGVGFAQRNPSGLPWNGYVLADPLTGTRLLQHKLHPVSYAPWNEHLSFRAGDGLRTADFGAATVATAICNDMWHPVVPWLAAQGGAEVLFVPVASMAGADEARVRRTWEVILEHAAVLLQCYVVFVNRCGTEGDSRFWGGSRVLGPDGRVLAELGDEPGSAVAELDLAALRRLRAEVPMRAEARADLFPASAGAVPARKSSESEPFHV